MSQDTNALLRVHNLAKSFGGLKAVDDLCFDVPKGAIFGLIGPNGSGKTTTFNLITGLLKPDAGEVYFREQDITGKPPYEVARLGVGRTFQILRLFRKLTVIENLLLASKGQSGENILLALANPPQIRRQQLDCEQKALEMLDMLDLAGLQDEYVGNLGYGEQKVLELARVLIMDPELVMLDEPTAGINPTFINRLLTHIRDLRANSGKTFLVVEHDMRVMMSLCEWIVVLDHGRKIAEGTPEHVSNAPNVIEAYLGV